MGIRLLIDFLDSIPPEDAKRNQEAMKHVNKVRFRDGSTETVHPTRLLEDEEAQKILGLVEQNPEYLVESLTATSSCISFLHPWVSSKVLQVISRKLNCQGIYVSLFLIFV